MNKQKTGSALEVSLGPLKLKNPVVTASGTFGYGEEYSKYVDLNDLGAITVKGLSIKPLPGNPPPRICETPSGMLNAIGLQNVGVDEFISGKLPFLRKFDTKVIANIFGNTVEEYEAVAARLDRADGVHAIEVNISCPNVERGGMLFADSICASPAFTESFRREMAAIFPKNPLERIPVASRVITFLKDGYLDPARFQPGGLRPQSRLPLHLHLLPAVQLRGPVRLGKLADLSRQIAAGEDHLGLTAHQGIQGIADFRLDLFLAAQKLHFFQEQDVALTPEALLEIGHAAALQGAHHFIGEIFRRQVKHLAVGGRLTDKVAHCLGQVALAQTGAGSDEEDVVVKSVVAGKGVRGLIGQTVGSSHHEFIKGEGLVQGSPGGPGRHLRQGRLGHLRQGRRPGRSGEQFQLHGRRRLPQVLQGLPD